jgi:hypothetical protein
VTVEGVACEHWLGRDDAGSSSEHNLRWALLLYNVGAFGVLAFSGSKVRMPVSRFGRQSGFTVPDDPVCAESSSVARPRRSTEGLSD